jgi:hypothetical protein
MNFMVAHWSEKCGISLQSVVRGVGAYVKGEEKREKEWAARTGSAFLSFLF